MATALGQRRFKPVSTRLLVTDPRHQFPKPVLKPVLGGIAQQTPGLRDVRNAVTDVAGTPLSPYLGLDLPAAHGITEVPGHVPHGDGMAGSDIEHLMIRRRMIQAKLKGTGDIGGVDKVPELIAILE